MGRWISGGTSCFNDDVVIGLRNLVTERGVIGQCGLIVERDVTEREFKILYTVSLRFSASGWFRWS
jgi:hypothetical protein